MVMHDRGKCTMEIELIELDSKEFIKFKLKNATSYLANTLRYSAQPMTQRYLFILFQVKEALDWECHKYIDFYLLRIIFPQPPILRKLSWVGDYIVALHHGLIMTMRMPHGNLLSIYMLSHEIAASR